VTGVSDVKMPSCAQSFASKKAWGILDERRNKLHATICGSLQTGEGPLGMDPGQCEALRIGGSISVELRGLFSGNLNQGAFTSGPNPEKRDGRIRSIAYKTS